MLATFFWSLFVAPPCVWFIFRTTKLLAVGVVLFLYALFMILVVSGIAVIASGGRMDGQLVQVVACFHTGVFLVLWSGLALLRRMGFSLVAGNPSSQMSESSPAEHPAQAEG